MWWVDGTQNAGEREGRGKEGWGQSYATLRYIETVARVYMLQGRLLLMLSRPTMQGLGCTAMQFS